MSKRALRVLVVEDEALARQALADLLRAEGYQVDLAENGAVALQRIGEVPPDVIVSDLNMPVMDGMQMLAELKARETEVPVIVVTSLTDLRAAVSAMRAGAADYLTKPIEFELLQLSIDQVLQNCEVRLEAENLRRQLADREGEGMQGLLGSSPVMQEVYRTARRIAGSRATVLVTGESGTGKGELARAIHALGPRAGKPFISVHCAALTDTLLESELFGHEKGSFTGAEKRRIGRFEQADGGTLFLDEIGEISPQTQIKLLTFLQERRFERVGGNETVSVDVRIVSATNRDLAADIAAGRFREDLFYRLNVIHIDMPPLRKRGGDVLALAEHFLRRFARENNRRIDGFSERARTMIRYHRWPGNVRALENAIEHAVVMCEGTTIDPAHLPFTPSASPTPLGSLELPGSTMADIERYAILTTLEAVDGSTVRAAELLDISVRTIQYRLHEYGLAKPRSSGEKDGPT